MTNSLDLYPLLDALLDRRSRRFAAGMRMNGGPLVYESARPAQPLSLEEQAALAFAANGVTGYALAELPFADGSIPEGGGGNIMMHLIARTAASGDGSHADTLFVIDDDGVWLLKRPQDYPRAEIAELIQAARERKWVDLYQQSRVRIGERRVDIPHDVQYMLSLNKWSANVPGSTYFLPIAELSGIYINIMLILFGEQYHSFVLDERNRFQPAGVGPFARSKGGLLNDDPTQGRVLTVGGLETLIDELAAIEQGGILQNLGLMTQALGLGGFPHFAAHPYIWPKTLGFRMIELPTSRVIGADSVTRVLLRLLKRDLPMPTAVGLERNGEVLIKPHCPPYYPTMRAAVEAFVADKYAAGVGIFRDGGAATGWQEGAKIQSGIPAYSDAAIAATTAYCEYVYARYGRLPANGGPFRTVLAYQAHHLDPDFYERFYKPDALSETQRGHQARWHGA
jgi:hypothetical protein